MRVGSELDRECRTMTSCVRESTCSSNLATIERRSVWEEEALFIKDL